MRNPIADAWNAFRAGYAAAGGSAEAGEEGDREPGAAAYLPGYATLPQTAAAPAKIDISQSAEFVAMQSANELQAAQIKTLGEQLGEMNTKMAVQAAGAQYAADAERVEKLVRQMKMTPAEGVGWKQLAKENPAAFAASIATQESRPVLTQIKADVVRAKLSAQGDPGAQLSKLARERAKADKISLAEAARLVTAENPELAQAHLQSAPVVSAQEATN